MSDRTYQNQWTVERLEALECAIADGTKRVKYSDKEVEYRSIDEMMRVRDLMREKLGLKKNCDGAKKGLAGGKRIVATHSKGLGDC